MQLRLNRGSWAASDLNLRKYSECSDLSLRSTVSTGASLLAGGAILPHSKVISEPALSKKSVPFSTAASVGSGRNKNLWSIFRPPRVKETSCLSLTSRDSPVNPKSQREMSLNCLRDTPGWSRETLEHVSSIRHRHFPSTSNMIAGAPCFHRTAIVGFPTAF